MIQLKAILSAKLTMDNRRASAFSQLKRSQEKKEMNKSTLGTAFGALLMGLFMLYSFGIGDDMVMKLSFFMTMFILMLCMTLVTDFTSVLIDVRDNFIILPKPITDATFVASRLLHITIRICIVMVPLSLPACILACVNEGPVVLLPFMLMVIMSVLLCIFLINAVYIVILKVTTPVKFQSIISYIQIAFTVVLFSGYQLMPRLMQNTQLSHLHLRDVPYIWLFPPYWFADGCLALTKMHFTVESVTSLAFFLFVPLISIWIVVRFFAPSFSRKLSMITAGTVEQSVAKAKTGKRVRISFIERLAVLLTRSGSEFMGFLFGWKMINRSRDFKMKVYPSFGIILVSGFMMFMNSEVGVPTGKVHTMLPMLLFVVYFSSLVLLTALMQLPFSEKYKASWIFRTAPVDSPGKIICGAVKSVIVFFYIPIALIVMVFGLSLMGLSVFPNLLLGCINVLAIGSVISLIEVRKLPFSTIQAGSSNGGGFF